MDDSGTGDTAHALMLSSLTSYFQRNAHHRKQLQDLIEARTAVSLRLLDWFVTHYAKKNNVLYWLDNDNNFHPTLTINGLRKFTVYTEYRAQLRAFSKHAFDPFRRHNRISFVVDERNDGSPVFVDTTIGQLNFFRWALQYKVIEYVLRNLSTIEDEMATFQQQRRESAPSKTSQSTEQKVQKTRKTTITTAVARPPPTRILFD